MKNISHNLTISIITFFMILSGCAPMAGMLLDYKKMYTGEPRPLSEIAILQTASQGHAYIISVDDEPYRALQYNKSTDVYELTPGNHTICVDFRHLTSDGILKQDKAGCSTIELMAKPGHVYVVYAKISTYEETWEPAISDITNELHTPQFKNIVKITDAVLNENRAGSLPVSILSLSSDSEIKSSKGFGENQTFNLKPWLKKDTTVSYKFRRYDPYITAKADDNIVYHLQIDQMTGKVINVFGKNNTDKELRKKTGRAWVFQELNSKLLYVKNPGAWTDTNIKSLWHKQKDGSYAKDIKSVWEEKNSGSYEQILSKGRARYNEKSYYSLIDTKLIDQFPPEAIKALVLAENTDFDLLSSYPHIKERINGKSKEEANYLLELEAIRLAFKANNLHANAFNFAADDNQKKNFDIIRNKIVYYLTKNLPEVYGGSAPEISYTKLKARFFKTPAKMIALEKRNYNKVFAREDSAYIGWELELTMPTRQETLNYKVKAVWQGSEGKIFAHQTVNGESQPTWTHPWCAHSWGYSQPGNWKPGNYKVNFIINGHYATSETFIIQ